MKNIITTILISIIISVLTIQAISFFWLPFGNSYSGIITKDSSTKVVEERIEEYKKVSNIESDISKAIETASPSVVSIITTKDLQSYMTDPYNFFFGTTTSPSKTTIKQPQQKIKVGWWSGIIITKDGYIITNKHVIEDNTVDYTVVTNTSETYSVKSIRRDPLLDIAILKIVTSKNEVPNDLQPAQFISMKSSVHIGQFVIAIGNALAEYTNSATFGIISAKNRSLNTQWESSSYIWLYQTDTPFNPGNSWGPLVNTAWEIIGINTATAQWEWIWFTIPLSKEFIDTTIVWLTSSGSISRPYFGVESNILTKAAAKNLDMTKFEWLYIQTVLPNSPAKIAGLLSGDVVTEINNILLESDMPLMYTLYTFKPWDTLSLLVYRNKEYKKLDVTLGSLNEIAQ